MATISVICYKSKTLSNGEHPLAIRISKDSKKSYKYLGVSVNPNHWDFKKNEPKPNCPNRDHILKIIQDKKAEYQTQVLEFKTSHKNFTASSLIKTTEQTTVAKTVDAFYRELIAHYRQIGKIGNSNIYRDSYNSMKRFKKVDRLDFFFSEIDLAWLNEYEKWMVGIGKAETSMSLLFRTLRSAYNKAIEDNVACREDYPFNSFKTSKFNVKTRKRAISKEDIRKVIEVDLANESYMMNLSRDIFIFSYLQGGINLTDIANLKYENINEGRLLYIRQKTKRLINIPLQENALKIIQKYHCQGATLNDYVFPILDKTVHIKGMQKFNRIHKIMGKVNHNLKLIAKRTKLEANLTTYVARHVISSFRLRTSELQGLKI